MTTDARRGWRVGHQGRDRMYYEELRDGAWERLAIDGEMLMGRAHHVIYFASPEQWLRYPAWARDRRNEIIARITSEFREPDYEYYGLTATPSATPPVARSAPEPAPPAPPPPAARPVPRKPGSANTGHRTLMIAVLVFFAVAAVMGWLVATGVARGETRLPLKQASLRRPVSRDSEPAMFWVSIGLYAALGTGALTLSVLGARAARAR
jgi:hypothetical protein